MRKLDKTYEKERKGIVKYLLIIIAILVSLNLLFLIIQRASDISDADLGSLQNENTSDSETAPPKSQGIEPTRFIKSEDSTLVEIKVPAVNSDGKGVATIISVEVTEGNGRTFVDIENLLFWADTQQSIRMARYVAGQTTKKDLNKYNLVYNIKADATVIGGPSAGSALTIATIFALEGLNPREDVFISGTINHDSTIGYISEVVEKAKASKEAGASIFLVPLLQSRGIIYETKEHCQEFGTSEICTTETRPIQVDLKEKYGLNVIEVENIKDAVSYFLRQGDEFSF
jgi:uncharacterized protein